MPKRLFRMIDRLLDSIDHSAGNEQSLVEILRMLVEHPDAAELGVVSGRLYRQREGDYLLIASIGGYGEAIAGKTVSRDYQVVRDIERHRVLVISPDSPGWDHDVEAQFSDADAAAISLGRDPAYLLSLGIQHHGSEDDLMVLLGTIRAAVGARLREETLANQMRQAGAIQHSLLPERLPRLPGFEIGAVSVPAEEVGGDVYDIQLVEDGVLGVMIADASGHGLPAALQARDVVIGLRMGQAEHHKISATVARLNEVIHRSSLASRFISLFYAELEEQGTLGYVNGGHCPPLLCGPGGEVYELKTCGPVLGPLPHAHYRRGYLTMRPGEALVMFTDGVTECAGPAASEDDPDAFGREGLVRAVQEALDRPAGEIAAHVLERVRAWGGERPFADDVSVVVVKRQRDGAEEAPLEDLTRLTPADSRR